MQNPEAAICWLPASRCPPRSRYLEIRLSNPHAELRTYTLYASSHDGLEPDRKIYRTHLAPGEWVHRTVSWNRSRNYSALLTCAYGGVEEWFYELDLRTVSTGEMGGVPA